MSRVEIRVPDLGDFSSADVIEVYVAVGDVLAFDDSMIALETDKAAMDVPATQAGRVVSIEVQVGDKISAGDLILTVEADQAEASPTTESEPAESAAPAESTEPAATAEPAEAAGATARPPSSASGVSTPPARTPPSGGNKLVVLGSGPGGYTAAFRAADLGMDVTLIERWPSLGGVCLNVGCIPSKALLHAARVIEEANEVADFGIVFGQPKIDTDKLRTWKDSVVAQLTRGLTGLAGQRRVDVATGTGRFISPRSLSVEHEGQRREIEFDQCIIAAGSEPMMLPNLPDDERIMDSTGALELAELPERMLVVGGGIIGLEMATVYAALGVRVSVVELTKTLIPGCDRDLVRPLQKRIQARYEAIMLGTRVVGIEAADEGIRVSFDGDQAPVAPEVYGRVLVAVGRRPNGLGIGAEQAGVSVDERGFITVDRQMRTNVGHIFAIGDIVGQPMLAHKATHEGKVAAEVAAGQKSYFDARAVPSVAYTDPEVAWVGLTEDEAKSQGRGYKKGSFPWAASGRALALGRPEGMTKLLLDEATGRVIGAGVVGPNAGDLIAEAALAIEMGCDAEDIGLTVHPHPTLSETLAFAAEVAAGTITDLYIPKS